MMNWSMGAEFLSILVLLIIAVNVYDKKYVATPRRRIFQACMAMTFVYILVDIVCVLTDGIAVFGMIGINYMLNMLYFVLSVWLSYGVCLYVFDLLLEHVYSKVCRERAYIGTGALTLGYTILCATNYWTKVLFWFDENAVYHKGPLNLLGYGVVTVEILMMLMCYFRNRCSICQDVVKVVVLIPLVALAIIIFQLYNPHILMNGSVIVFVLLILYISYQGTKADQDNLTKLGSRKSFFEELRLRLGGRQKFQVILINLFNFGTVNRNFGHNRGDEFLYAVSNWLDHFSEESRAFRFGSVSFVLVCPCSSSETGYENLERIKARFEENWELGELGCPLPAQFGHLLYQGQDWNATQVMEALSQMQDEMKLEKTPFKIFDETMFERLEQRERMSLLLKEAIDQDRFQVWYQPVFDLEKGRFTSAEALVRMADEEGNLISPLQFIPLAEENGTIYEISWIVLEKVCGMLAENEWLPFESISINLSMQQFMDSDLWQKVEEHLESYKIDPGRLKLEITERVFLYDQERLLKIMTDMKERGVGFYLDDFGTGYSNLASVMHLPFECIKLDKSLFDRIEFSESDQFSVESMTRMFQQLGMCVIAEGIESRQQLEIVRDAGIDRVQGYVTARPMSEAELLEFLKEKSFH